jgi:hypothetical protein
MAAAMALGLVASGAVVTPTAAQASCLTWLQVKQGNGVQAVLNADNFGGGNVCLTNTGGAANFTVASQSVAYTGKVLSYPDINVGNEGGYCSVNSGLPAPEATVNPRVAWTIKVGGAVTGTKYDAAIDSWFSTDVTGCKPARRGEVLVFLNSSSFSGLGLPHSGNLVTIDGLQWYALYKPATSTRPWPMTEYAPPQANVINSVTALAMKPFYKDAVAHGNLRSDLSLVNIGAGFELWAGGAGLATTVAEFDRL